MVWNGQDEKGHRVADGEYHVVLKAWDNNKNTSTYKGSVVVDTVVPAVSGKAQYRIFSPNNDGARETVAFQLSPGLLQRGIR